MHAANSADHRSIYCTDESNHSTNCDGYKTCRSNPLCYFVPTQRKIAGISEYLSNLYNFLSFILANYTEQILLGWIIF